MSAPNERLAHLFIVRFWLEPGLSGAGQWRGMVEQLPGGPCRYFASLVDLDDFLFLFLAGRSEGERLPGTLGNDA
jgi:hypothetical protein